MIRAPVCPVCVPCVSRVRPGSPPPVFLPVFPCVSRLPPVSFYRCTRYPPMVPPSPPLTPPPPPVQAAGSVLRVHLKDADDTLIGQFARLIAQQWPSTSAPRRRTAMCMASLLNRSNNRKLPCHLALTDAQGTALCHARLSPTRDDEDGFGVLLTSLVVAPSYRRRGLGRQMLEFAEEVAVGLGSSFLALSTPDMQAFYLACGYHVRDHPTLKPVPHVSRSDAAAVRAVMGGASEILEIATSQAGASAADLAPSAAPAAPSVPHKRRNWAKGEMAEHVLSCFHIRLRPTGGAEDGDDVAVEAHTWLRKALVAGDGTDALAQRRHFWTRAALVAYVRQVLSVDMGDGGAAAAAVHVTPSALHWEHQVGDTCGLQALRAARSWFHGWGIGGRGAAPEGPGTEQVGEEGGEKVGEKVGEIVDVSAANAPARRPHCPQLSQLVESIGVLTLTATGQAMPAVEGADDEPCPRRHVASSLAIEPHWGMPLSAELSAVTAASVLQTALTAGYTNYGELFDASDLAELAATCCGLDAAVLSYAEDDLAAADEVWGRLLPRWLESDGLAIVAYAKAALPTANVLSAGGPPETAHYMLLVGTARNATKTVPMASPAAALPAAAAAGATAAAALPAAGATAAAALPAAGVTAEEPRGQPLLLIALQGLSPRPLIVPVGTLRSSNERLRPEPMPRHCLIHPEIGMRLSRRVVLLGRAQKSAAVEGCPAAD